MTLALERLESRILLAAEVSAKLTGGGTLKVNGTGGDDVIQILIEAGGHVEVYADTDGNGVADEIGIFDGVTNLKVNTKGGNDEVLLLGNHTPLSGDIDVKTGGGDDCLFIDDVAQDGSLSVKTGGGKDIIGIEDQENAGDVSIKTGGDDDFVFVQFVPFDGGIDADGSVDISLGSGKDTLKIVEADLAVGAGGKFNGGRGTDQLIGQDIDTLLAALDGFGVTVDEFEESVSVADADVTEPAARMQACIDDFDLY